MLAQRKARKTDWSPLWLTEDWWTVWLGGIILVLAVAGIITSVPRLPKWAGEISQALPLEQVPSLLILGVCLGIATAIAVAVMKGNARKYLVGFPFVFVLAVLAYIIGNHATMAHYGFNDVIWALVLGMVFSNIFGKPAWLTPSLRSELFIKTGLILLGAEILFNRVLTLGGYGLGVAWIIPPIVLIFMHWYGNKVLKIESPSLVSTVAACTAVCGVSAAIAAGSATKAKKEEISVAISISLLSTIIMMIALPFLINAMGLSEAVGGAWIGGTVDSTGAVVVAASMVGNEAMEVAAVIKMLQNVLIGFVAFILATFFITRVERGPDDPKPGLGELWRRFPKFIIGFIAASLVFSFVLIPLMGNDTVDTILRSTKGLRGWLFTLAFVSIGLDSRFADILRLCKGKGPIQLHIVGQIFNVVMTLIAAWIFFSGKFFAI
ncbi:MAG: putative sulfate exporter family transporter [Firmicutes bacterium]|nr:putative sulfate exporter family transporter [Bacillota bacterium]